MPSLDSPIHLNMLRASYQRGNVDEQRIYGLEWGDPNSRAELKTCRDRYIQPYIKLDHSALEIGPGGGRWTRYLLSFRELYVVDNHVELLSELAKNFRAPHLIAIHNSGTDLPGIPPASIDYVFSFSVFVHLDLPIIAEYLRSLFVVVKDTANIVIQYSDKTKKLAAANPGFSDNNPAIMRRMVNSEGFTILEEDLDLLPQSAIMRFCKG